MVAASAPPTRSPRSTPADPHGIIGFRSPPDLPRSRSHAPAGGRVSVVLRQAARLQSDFTNSTFVLYARNQECGDGKRRSIVPQSSPGAVARTNRTTAVREAPPSRRSVQLLTPPVGNGRRANNSHRGSQQPIQPATGRLDGRAARPWSSIYRSRGGAVPHRASRRRDHHHSPFPQRFDASLEPVPSASGMHVLLRTLQ